MYQKHLLQPTNWQPILRKAFVITCRSHSNVFARCPFHEGTCCPPMWSELDDACWCYDPEVSIRIILMDLELSPRSFQQGQPSPCQKQFVSAILKIREKTSKLTRSKKRGWYTKDKMKTKLGWSKLPGSKLRASLSTEQFGFQQKCIYSIHTMPSHKVLHQRCGEVLRTQGQWVSYQVESLYACMIQNMCVHVYNNALSSHGCVYLPK